MKLIIFAACVAITYSYQIKSAPLLNHTPEWMTKCQKTDPDLDQCLKRMFQKIFPYLAVGIPEINVDKFEPLPLDSVTVSKGNGPVTLTGSLYEMSVAGPKNATPTYTHADFAKGKFNFGLHLPLLDITSRYDLKGKILVLPLVGNGHCEILLKDVRTNVFTDISFKKIENREILHFDKMKVNFKVKAMKVDFKNLFNGNRVLGLTMNNFVNQNGQEVIAELEENISQNLATIFLELINNIFSKVPIDLWLLEDSNEETTNNNKETDTKESLSEPAKTEEVKPTSETKEA